MSQIVDVPGVGPVEFPDDMSDDQIAAAIKKNFMIGSKSEAPQKAAPPAPPMFGIPNRPTDPDEAIKYMREHGFGSGIPRLADMFGEKLTDLSLSAGLPPQGAAAVGTLGNVVTQALPSLLTSASPVGAAPPSMFPSVGKFRLPNWLMQTAVKPSTDDLLSGAAKKAVSTMLDEGITPTMGGMHKASKLASQLDDQVGAAIANSQAKVSVPSVASRLNDTLKQAEMQVNPKTDIQSVENAWTEFLTSPHVAGKKEIPVQLAHELKKGTYRSLGGKSYGEVGSTSVEAQKTLARGLREDTMAAVPEIADPLARQAALMNVKDVAGARALLEANKNPMGLAALRVDHPLSSASFIADRWAWLKAMLAMGLHRGTYPQAVAPVGLLAAQTSDEPKANLLKESLGLLASP
jgi:hypothetical protein